MIFTKNTKFITHIFQKQRKPDGEGEKTGIFQNHAVYDSNKNQG